MNKRWKGILIAAIVAVFLVTPAFLVGSLGAFSPAHARMIYSINSEQFEIAADRVLKQGSADNVRMPNGVKDIDLHNTHSGCVDFYMGGFGLVPSTTYWGVIYTTEDAPVGWGGLDVEFVRDGEGWYWQEEEGDNSCSVTKLADHWYMYEMRF